MNDSANPVREWLRAARKEFGSPDEMRAAATSVRSANTRTLLEREATEWAREELRFAPDKTGTRQRAKGAK